jgi:hypothetical protein
MSAQPVSPPVSLPAPRPAPGTGSAAPAAGAPRRTHRWGLGAYVLVEALFLGVSGLIGALFAGGRLSVPVLIVALTVPTVLAAGVTLLITWLRGGGPRADLGLVWSWSDVRTGLAYGFGGLVVTIPVSLLYAVVVGPDRVGSAVGDAFAGLRAGPLAAVAVGLVVVVVAPVCEEIVYRGLLWGAVERRTSRPWAPFTVTTLLFAVAHLELSRTPLLLVVALPIALARLRTGRLGASIVAHQVNNLLPGLALVAALLGLIPAL